MRLHVDFPLALYKKYRDLVECLSISTPQLSYDAKNKYCYCSITNPWSLSEVTSRKEADSFILWFYLQISIKFSITILELKELDTIQQNCYIFRICSLIKIQLEFFSNTVMLQTDMPQRLAHIKGFKEQKRICIYFKLLYKYTMIYDEDFLHIENVTPHFPSLWSFV